MSHCQNNFLKTYIIDFLQLKRHSFILGIACILEVGKNDNWRAVYFQFYSKKRGKLCL